MLDNKPVVETNGELLSIEIIEINFSDIRINMHFHLQ